MNAIQRFEDRKRKITNVLTLIDGGMDVSKACQKVGISKPTFYHWKRGIVADASTENELLTHAPVYAKRLTKALRDSYGLLLDVEGCIRLVRKMLSKNEDYDYYEYAPKSNPYIELTSHTLNNEGFKRKRYV